MFKRKGGGVKGLLNNVKKTALFSHVGFPNQDYSASLVYPYSVGFLDIPLPTSSVLKRDDLPKNIFLQNFESCRTMVPSIRPYSPRNPLRPFRPKYEKAAATLPPIGRRN